MVFERVNNDEPIRFPPSPPFPTNPPRPAVPSMHPHPPDQPSPPKRAPRGGEGAVRRRIREMSDDQLRQRLMAAREQLSSNPVPQTPVRGRGRGESSEEDKEGRASGRRRWGESSSDDEEGGAGARGGGEDQSGSSGEWVETQESMSDF